MIVLREMALAKVNLYLHVTGRRPDGYHELDSWVAFADIGDTLEAVKADSLTLKVDGPQAHALPAEGNSVLKAAQAITEHYGITQGAALTLTKRLPVAAGIGGGSADAAAALRLLCRLWGITPPPRELAALALTLGADMPACLRSQALYMSGIGEKLAPAPSPQGWHAVLVNPGKALLTREVFAALEPPFSSAARHPAAFDSEAAALGFLKHTRNDLQAPAARQMPVIESVLAALDVQPGCALARMSGSGATCFGIYNTEENAQNTANLLSEAYPEWWVQQTRLR